MSGDMILYHGEPNGPSLAVLAVLAETGLDIECRWMDLAGGERHRLSGIGEPLARDMGVEGEGPVLVIDGEAMTESVFIAQFLDESGNGALQPQDAYGHWQMLMWCRRITERCAPAAAFLGCRAHAHAGLAAMEDAAFADLRGAIVSEDLASRWSAVRSGDFPEAQVADSKAKVAAAVGLVEEQLEDGRAWLMGPLTIADFETYCWLAGMVELVPDAFAGKARAAGWMARMRARPSVRGALARARRADPEHAWAPGPEINRWG
ncbi:GST-like protein [Novosphingobium sp. CF614]|uniref:glutathione S-transferase family protein n=1 Tax=Novosphingobium sp. CF614 TaxID=1884364 RepID=UPI0008DEAA4E|nr:glutathione S-transferase [Novosphingobium sp. CF614]SFF89786.1 GST-like protein [Novosphingobium sp. CF614]